MITCASGASPSGPVHLGNLREFLTVHFVAEEIQRRGIAARHLHSWDDYDRFRKVPAGIDPSWSEHIGRPLSAVPDPWSCHESWAEHYKAPLRAALRRAGRRDGGGLPDRDVPRRRLPRADPHRRTPPRRDRAGDVALPHRRRPTAAPESEQEAAAMADSVANDDESGLTGMGATDDLARFPYKPYCRDCGRDTTTSRRTTTRRPTWPTPARRARTTASPTSPPQTRASWSGRSTGRCAGSSRASTSSPAGVDHASPGSSYTVGKELVKRSTAAARRRSSATRSSAPAGR